MQQLRQPFVCLPLFPDIPRREQPAPDDEQPHQGDWYEDLPAQTHDLVIPEPWESGANPDEHGHHDESLDTQPDPARNEVQCGNGREPTTRNIRTATMDTSHMLAYSARKKMAKPMPEYSTMWPATISASLSTTSMGWRLVSATLEIR